MECGGVLFVIKVGFSLLVFDSCTSWAICSTVEPSAAQLWRGSHRRYLTAQLWRGSHVARAQFNLSKTLFLFFCYWIIFLLALRRTPPLADVFRKRWRRRFFYRYFVILSLHQNFRFLANFCDFFSTPWNSEKFSLKSARKRLKLIQNSKKKRWNLMEKIAK